MQHRFITICLLLTTPAVAQQPNTPLTQPPSAEFLNFLADFNLTSISDEQDYDIIEFHALQDLKKSLQEKPNDY